MLRARKIEALKQLRIDREVSEGLVEDLHIKIKFLKKLQLLFTSENDEDIDVKQLESDIKRILKNEKAPQQRELFVPEYLICVISGDIMFDPVTLESG